MPLRPLTAEEIACYHNDGIVVLRGLFDREWIEHLVPLVDTDMATPGPLHLELEKKGNGGRFFFRHLLVAASQWI